MIGAVLSIVSHIALQHVSRRQALATTHSFWIGFVTLAFKHFHVWDQPVFRLLTVSDQITDINSMQLCTQQQVGPTPNTLQTWQSGGPNSPAKRPAAPLQHTPTKGPSSLLLTHLICPSTSLAAAAELISASNADFCTHEQKQEHSVPGADTAERMHIRIYTSYMASRTIA